MIRASIICDSISPHGNRLTTFRLRYPKFIHGELMTHRVFSRNASSSRAVPVKKNLEEVRSDELRASPVHWGAEQKGMASGEELNNVDKLLYADDYAFSGKTRKEAALQEWKAAALMAARTAEDMIRIGVHKSIVNRILEPFLHINVIVTATEYMNFFGLRLDKAAQPEMRVLAEAMWSCYNESNPFKLQPDQWHCPYLDFDAMSECMAYAAVHNLSGNELGIKVSVARCARVSFMNFQTGKRSTIEEDLELHDRLVGSHPMHASPAEHQATPDKWTSFWLNGKEYHELGASWAHPDEHGNFIGWRQYRKMLKGESCAPLPESYEVRVPIGTELSTPPFADDQ